MAGRTSVVLRDQFEVAKRQGAIHGRSTNLDEVREKVVLALGIVRERLQPIDAAAARHDVAWLAATYPDWVSERSLLRDEAQELKRLLDHLDQELDSGR
jgi:hypothetical protein